MASWRHRVRHGAPVAAATTAAAVAAVALLGTVSLATASRPSTGIAALHFACNTSGVENTTQLREDARYAQVIFEFRHRMNDSSLPGGWTDQEAVLQQQAAALHDQSPSPSPSPPLAFVYRHGGTAGHMFRLQRAVMNRSATAGWFTEPQPAGSWWQPWNWSNTSAADYFVDTVVGEAAAEAAVGGVFFDGADGPCGDAAAADPHAAQRFNDTVDVLRRSCALLQSHGKRCILSLTNAMASTAWNLVLRCPYTEDVVVERMRGVPWTRYYQHWMDGFLGNLVDNHTYDPHLCRAMVTNAVAEVSRGIPISVRAPSPPSKYETTLPLSLAAYLVAVNDASPASGNAYGFASCWFDQCWAWQDAFDMDVGAPRGPVVVSDDSMVFTRQWAGAKVRVDCRTGVGTVTPTASEADPKRVVTSD